MTIQTKAPQREKFYYANIISTIQGWFIFIGTVLSLFTLFNLPEIIKYYINIAICVISILYLITELIFPYIFQKANEDKIKDLIDNGLNSKLSDENSENYYTNDEVKDGLPKLGVNNFESVFFTKNIVCKMIKKKIVGLLCVILFYLLSVFSVEKSNLIIIFQLLLPIQVIKEFVYLWLFHLDIKQIFEDYKKIYTTIKKSEQTSYIIQNIILYEKLLSNYHILVSSKIYGKLNGELSKKWEELKKKTKIG